MPQSRCGPPRLECLVEAGEIGIIYHSYLKYSMFFALYAAVVKLVYTPDLKSCGSNTVWVRFPPAAHHLYRGLAQLASAHGLGP